MTRLLAAGHRGLLVECDDLPEVMALHRALEEARAGGALPGVVDLVPAARTVLVTFDETASHSRIAEALAALEVRPRDDDPTGREVQVDVSYGGDDLDEVARLSGLSVEEVVRRHAAATYVVAFTGFAPGFAYLVGGDPALVVPRRDTPRTRVPRGSVALAGEFTGIYPQEGPGGWQLIGRTEAPLWDLDREPPALLAPGTRVRFARLDP
ncbi:allophanate hydrolase subunit 1 [Terrabacter carboxydivorans]|uniref:Allophanate hydrolase subunit 1 n=1 Tax=Terrabacter carboxydivorans TaxID=619730 RepID=A0ABP5YU29_9MICO